MAHAEQFARFPGGVRLGVAWYPDEVAPERWPVDVALMRDAGMTLVRMAEYGWARLEPKEGVFDFSWIDASITLLADSGIDVVLGTPTAAPPAWLVSRYPEARRVDPNGRPVKFRSDSRFCPNAPALHTAVDRVVTVLAERYGRDRRVVGWQVDNELGGDLGEGDCYCDLCERVFQGWLKQRYGSLDKLNARWGTTYRGEMFSAWNEIPFPDSTSRWLNPGLGLDARRFLSDSQIRFQARQIRILRARCVPEQPLMHNLMSPRVFGAIDYQRLADDLDIVGLDNYPSHEDHVRWSSAAFDEDLARGYKEKRFWCLEQQVGAIGIQTMQSPHPDQPRLWVYQAIAHGAEALLYWPWRTPRFGGSQHWLGVIDADGRRGPRYGRVAALAKQLRELGDTVSGLHPAAEAAVVHDYESRFALAVQPTNCELAYSEVLQRHYEALRRLGVGINIVPALRDVSRYRLLVAANMYVLDEERAAWLAGHADRGGILVIAPRTGARDFRSAIPERPQPGFLDELAGVEVADVMSSDGSARIAGALEGTLVGWYEALEPKGAEVLARYADGPYADAPALTRYAGVYYLGGSASPETLDRLYALVAAEAGLVTVALPEGVEALRTTNAAGDEILFLLNHAAKEHEVVVGETLALPPFGVAVLRHEEAERWARLL